MKTRHTFVSNSSSSSFVLWGIEASNEQFDTIDALPYGKIGDITCRSGLDELEGHFIGIHPTSMKDEETLLQFKQRVVDTLNSFNLNVKIEDIDFYMDAGNDNC